MTFAPSNAEQIMLILQSHIPLPAADIRRHMGGYKGTGARLAELMKRGKVRKAGMRDGKTLFTVVERIVPMEQIAQAAPEPVLDSKRYSKALAKMDGSKSWFIVQTKRGAFSSAPTAYRSSARANKIAKAIGGQVIIAIEKEIK